MIKSLRILSYHAWLKVCNAQVRTAVMVKRLGLCNMKICMQGVKGELSEVEMIMRTAGGGWWLQYSSHFEVIYDDMRQRSLTIHPRLLFHKLFSFASKDVCLLLLLLLVFGVEKIKLSFLEILIALAAFLSTLHCHVYTAIVSLQR